MHRQIAAALAILLHATAANALDTRPISAQFQSAKALDGTAVQLDNRVTVLNFWATWCVPCRVELPILDGFYRAHQRDGLAVVALAMDAGAPTGALKRATAGFVLPVVPLSAVRMRRGDVPNGVPVTRVYDRHGRLRFDSARDGHGTLDAATLDRVVLPLLREP